MAKAKSAPKSSQDKQTKSISSVKDGGVTKPSQTSKAKSKEIAKLTAAKSGNIDKKSKKVKDDSSVPSNSDAGSESEEESEDSSASSASSEDSEEESEDETPAAKPGKAKAVKANGKAGSASDAGESSDSSEASESNNAEDSESEKSFDGKAKDTTLKSDSGAIKSAHSTAKDVSKSEKDGSEEEGSSDEEDSDGDSEDEEESEEDVKPRGPVDAKELNGKLEKVASKEASSDEESESGSGSDEDSSPSASEEESENEKVPAPQKRKAEEDPVTPAAKKAKSDDIGNYAAKKNLFIGQLSYHIDEEWLSRAFEEHGELSSVKIIMDNQTGRSRGFGYVEFVNSADATKAKDIMHHAELDGRKINVDFADNKPDRATPRGNERQKQFGDRVSEKSDTLFVANLSFEANEDVVGEEFGQHGNVAGVRLPTDINSGAPKGFGYVQFNSVEEAEKVFEAMQGASILGRRIRLDYSTPRAPRNGDTPRGGRGHGDRGRGRGGFNDRGGRGGGRGGERGRGRGGGRGNTTNRGGFGDFKGRKQTFE